MSGKRNWTERRDGKNPPPVYEGTRKYPSTLWRKLYGCKKTKGEHTWYEHEIKVETRHWWGQGGDKMYHETTEMHCGSHSHTTKKYFGSLLVIDIRCRVCGKHGWCHDAKSYLKYIKNHENTKRLHS